MCIRDSLRATGTLLLLSGIITCFVYKIKAADAVQALSLIHI